MHAQCANSLSAIGSARARDPTSDSTALRTTPTFAGNLKAKKLLDDEAKAAIAAVHDDHDGMLEGDELTEAYTNLGARLDKGWSAEKIQNVVNVQLRAREMYVVRTGPFTLTPCPMQPPLTARPPPPNRL